MLTSSLQNDTLQRLGRHPLARFGIGTIHGKKCVPSNSTILTAVDPDVPRTDCGRKNVPVSHRRARHVQPSRPLFGTDKPRATERCTMAALNERAISLFL